ncbi:MAG: hypothetical protein RLZZ216_687 [Cyanobacteriota bacterium]|jgi:GNAT superfamily N-acetyltransferase
MFRPVRSLQGQDHDLVVEIYRQAVLGSTAGLYSAAQQHAWAEQGQSLRSQLQQGEGFVVCDAHDQPQAFSLCHPSDRVALLYCHPAAQRQGCGQRLLEAIEHRARAQAIATLRTEASLISKPLFERLGWQVSWREELRIGGVGFHRFRMHKPLGQGY